MEKIDVDALIERLETGEPTANLYIVAALRQQQVELEELREALKFGQAQWESMAQQVERMDDLLDHISAIAKTRRQK